MKVMKLLALLVLLKICCINAIPSDGPQFPPPFRPWRSQPAGHLKSFGHQRPPDGPVRPYIDRFLHPVDFWEYHVSNKLPLVYRNAVNRSPAIKLWDDEYLLKNYGNLDVLVERKVENRSYSPRRMVLKGFLKQYRKEDIYVVTVLPDAMRHEVQVHIKYFYFKLNHMQSLQNITPISFICRTILFLFRILLSESLPPIKIE